MRWGGQRDVSGGVHECDALACQSIQIGRGLRQSAICSHAIRAERVNRDEDHVRRWRHHLIRLLPCTPAQYTRCHVSDDDEEQDAVNDWMGAEPRPGRIRIFGERFGSLESLRLSHY